MVNSSYIYSLALTKFLNDCERSGNFPDILKYADITPVLKKSYEAIQQTKVTIDLLVTF